MKTTVFFFLIGTALGKISKPDFSVGLNFDHDTTAGSLGAVVPRVKWDSEETSIAGLFDVQGGIDSTLTNIQTPPDTYVWGEAKRFFSKNGCAVAIRGDMSVNEHEVIDLDLRVNGFRNTAGLRLLGSADLCSNSVTLDKMMATKNIDSPFGMPGKMAVNLYPPMKRKSSPVATVEYAYKSTSLKVDTQQGRFTLSRAFGRSNRNKIVPTIVAKTGDFGLSYSRNLSGGGRVTTSWKPNESVNLEWTDGNWQARIRAPIEGWCRKGDSGVKLSMKRNVGVSLY